VSTDHQSGQGELDLVARAGSGDVAAFELLYARYRRLVAAVCRRAAGPEYGEDAAQVVWANLWLGQWRPGPARPGHDLTPFVAFICRRAAYIRLREARRHHPPGAYSLDGHDEDAEPIDPPAPDVDPLDTLYRERQVRQLRGALAGLTPHERRLLHLRYVDGLKIQTIAEGHDTRSMHGVALHLIRIHRQLSARLGGCYRPPRRGERFDLGRITKHNIARRRMRTREAARCQ
jgi:RNA polymerase sigma factor (sigma-70 family)